MIFIDTSAYLAILLPFDTNKSRALEILSDIEKNNKDTITSYQVLGEILTVSSQRYNRQAGIDFVKKIFKSKTKIILENQDLLDETFKTFQKIKDKDVGWVDCFSFAIIDQNDIGYFFSFDKDFKKFAKGRPLI